MYIIEEEKESKFTPFKIKIKFDDYGKSLALFKVLNAGLLRIYFDKKNIGKDEYFDELNEFIEDFGIQIEKSVG
jgi:hypothetical protein